jgi:hypothetical protein
MSPHWHLRAVGAVHQHQAVALEARRSGMFLRSSTQSARPARVAPQEHHNPGDYPVRCVPAVTAVASSRAGARVVCAAGQRAGEGEGGDACAPGMQENRFQEVAGCSGRCVPAVHPGVPAFESCSTSGAVSTVQLMVWL